MHPARLLSFSLTASLALLSLPASAQQGPRSFQVTSEQADVHEAANFDSVILVTVRDGEAGRVLNVSGEWARVLILGKQGFVHTALISVTSGSGEQVASTARPVAPVSAPNTATQIAAPTTNGNAVDSRAQGMANLYLGAVTCLSCEVLGGSVLSFGARTHTVRTTGFPGIPHSLNVEYSFQSAGGSSVTTSVAEIGYPVIFRRTPSSSFAVAALAGYSYVSSELGSGGSFLVGGSADYQFKISKFRIGPSLAINYYTTGGGINASAGVIAGL